MTNEPEIFEPDGLSADDHRLIDVYVRVGQPVDKLAYTAEFEALFKILTESGERRGREEIFRRLLNLRKAGRFPRRSSP